jgi:hypothetical protein
MPIDGFSLNPIFARVFPTFKPGQEAIDLKGDKNEPPDGIIQSNEVLQPSNDLGNEETEIDDEEIVSFFKENIQNIPEDKIEELFSMLLDYVKENPMGGYFYEGENSFCAQEIISVIISAKPKYAPDVESFLSSNNFLIRWAAVGIFSMAEIKDNNTKDVLLVKLMDLFAKEQKQQVANEQQEIKVTYYQVNELYAEYLQRLKGLINYLSK